MTYHRSPVSTIRSRRNFNQGYGTSRNESFSVNEARVREHTGTDYYVRKRKSDWDHTDVLIQPSLIKTGRNKGTETRLFRRTGVVEELEDEVIEVEGKSGWDDGSIVVVQPSLRRAPRNKDNDRWEDSQLLRSGAVRGTEVAAELDSEEERKVVLLVHDTSPRFLNGRIASAKQANPILPLKDPTSDLAVIARNGSALVREMHEKRSMDKSRQRFWELAGSKLGEILGVEKTAEEIGEDLVAVGEEGEVDFREDGKFARYLKNDGAVSDFAKSKTISEQRQYLPIFSVREELLNIIRENQVVVVVGETGSGKTTQLMQYLYEDGYTTSGIVGCTQPRRVAVTSVAKRVSEEMETELGDKVGYAIRFEDRTGPNTVIKVMINLFFFKAGPPHPNPI